MFQPMSSTEKQAWEQNKKISIVVEDLIYKLDEAYGMLDRSVSQIGVVNILDGSVNMLTSGSMQCKTPVWSPDGRHVAFYGFPKAEKSAPPSAFHLRSNRRKPTRDNLPRNST